MQLSCKRHWIAGWRVDATCPKCAPSRKNSATLDERNSGGHFFETSSSLSSSSAPNRGVTRPVGDTARTKAQGEGATRTQRNLPPSRADATRAPQAAKHCEGCDGEAAVVVQGLALCGWCGERVSDVAATGAFVGVTHEVVWRAMVPWLRGLSLRRGAA